MLLERILNIWAFIQPNVVVFVYLLLFTLNVCIICAALKEIIIISYCSCCQCGFVEIQHSSSHHLPEYICNFKNI